MKYLSIIDNQFGFKDNSINQIEDRDIVISDEIYNQFFELQTQGKQFKIKNINGSTFEDIFEEYIPEEAPYEPTQLDLTMVAIAQLDVKREQDKVEAQLAIAELANSLLGGVS